MHSERSGQGERAVAMVAALAINVAVLWGLKSAMRPTPRVTDDALVLQAVWILRPSSGPPAMAPAPRSPRHHAPPAAPAARPLTRTTHAPTPAAGVHVTREPITNPPSPVGGRSSAEVYLAQLRQAGMAEATALVVARDPLADRHAAIPGRPTQRFRMREPMSPARALAMAGRLFGGNDPKEPCRSNRARIADLGTAGNSGRLQQELDFERRWCRP